MALFRNFQDGIHTHIDLCAEFVGAMVFLGLEKLLVDKELLFSSDKILVVLSFRGRHILEQLMIPFLNTVLEVSFIDLGEPKINQNSLASELVVEEVLRLDISVENSDFLQTFYAFQQLQHVMFHISVGFEFIEQFLN